jgi:hydrogenase maturation factor
MLLPEGNTDQKVLEAIFKDLLSACTALDISVCGGHSEVTYGLNRPILIGQLLGEVEKEKLVRKDRIRPGDVILLTKGIAIEGTSLIARELGSVLSGKIDPSVVERAKGFLTAPGISIVKEALTAVSCGPVHGMHDPTEGGLATGLWELAQRAKVGMHILGDAIIVLPETRLLCDILNVNPMGLLASGALLVVVDSEYSMNVQEAIQKEGISCTPIGGIREASYGVRMERDGIVEALHTFEVDELARILGEQ